MRFGAPTQDEFFVSETAARGLADLVYNGAVTDESVARLAEISPAAIGTYQDEYRLTAQGWRHGHQRRKRRDNEVGTHAGKYRLGEGG